MMVIVNLPKIPLTVIPTTTETQFGVTMLTFKLRDIPYSLEEAVAIQGFVGYITPQEEGKFMLSSSAVNYDSKGRPKPIVGVVFFNSNK